MSTLRRYNRRPPRDPSAALRPRNALEKAAMESAAARQQQQIYNFQQKLQRANQVSICNTTSDRVGRMPIRQLLQMDTFCVPIFQRRYCWTKIQWETLIMDVAGTTGATDTTATSSPSSSSHQENEKVTPNISILTPKTPPSNSSRPQQQPQKQPHSLGRLTCTRTYNAALTTTNIATGATSAAAATTTAQEKNGQNLEKSPMKKPSVVNNSTAAGRNLGIENRSCILDGQQRFTTVTILLAAIRDVWKEERLFLDLQEKEKNSNHEDNAEHQAQQNEDIASLIDGLLFTNPIEMRAWMQRPNSKLDEGIELPFARLVPTFCDRWAYYAAILPGPAAGESGAAAAPKNGLVPPSMAEASAWDRPLQAKQYFLNKLRQDFCTRSKLIMLLKGVLDGLTMLYFPIDLHRGRDDGTEDLMVIYERLALRDATFCKPPRGEEESKSMGGADMIRNLLLGSFAKEQDALEYYKKYWLAMEKMTIMSSEESNSTTTFGADRATMKDAENDLKESHDEQLGSMEELLQAFLKCQNDFELSDLFDDSSSVIPIVGGKIYKDFKAWFGMKTSLTENHQGNEEGFNGESHRQRFEEKVRQVGEQLLKFCRKSFADATTRNG